MVTIDGYPLDLVETEEHSMTSEITEHPVEDGSDISDNIRIKPRELTLTNAIVSNTPIGTVATDDTRILGETLPPPAMDAYRRLEQIWLARSTVTVVTNLKKYESMALETLTIPQEAKNAGGLVFTAHFKEVRIVRNKRVTMAIPNTGGEQNLGLTLDKLTDGKKILWRKGAPPGLSEATVPPGRIYAQEIVTMDDRKAKGVRYLHPDGTELGDAEFVAFRRDLDRDTSLMTNRGLYRAEQQLNQEGTVTERAEKLADYKLAHPGENPDPALFGLEQQPNGHWIAK